MLRFKRLTVTNFGPFKEEQSLEFPPESGVTIVYGDNGRGKTTLLNAFRYALFGKVKTRNSRELPLADLINLENAAYGQWNFKVVLEFAYEGEQYELTRQVALRSGAPVPSDANDTPDSADLDEKMFVRRSGDTLGPDEGVLAIARLMPEQVSRFFLFDGELLQEYEELLRQDSLMGNDIKLAIERILGVPVLTQSRQDLAQLKTNAERQESQASAKDVTTKALQQNLREKIDAREAHESIIEERRKEKERIDGLRTANNAEISRFDRIRELLQKRDRLKEEVDETDQSITERYDKLKETLTGSWKGMLVARAMSIISTKEQEFNGLTEIFARKSAAQRLLNELEAGLSNGTCATCRRSLDDPSKTEVGQVIARLKDEASVDDDVARRTELERELMALRTLAGESKEARVEELVEQIDALQIKRSGKLEDIREIEQDTQNAPEADIQRLWSEQQNLIKEGVLLDQAIRKEQDALAATVTDITRIQGRLDRSSDTDLAKERRQREICTQLYNLMDEAVSVYRDELRLKVEADATTLFRSLTSEPEFVGLQINENYGLTILHEGGAVMKVRSAGQEHVVALSLMGALQRNAPMKGPIIMDSPFGRLDDTHKGNITKTLPLMADQVMLLVYRSELDPKVARANLEGSLRREFVLRRNSALNTVIERNTGAL